MLKHLIQMHLKLFQKDPMKDSDSFKFKSRFLNNTDDVGTINV